MASAIDHDVSLEEHLRRELEKPLTSELKLEVKLQLEEYWRFQRRDVTFRMQAKSDWYHTDGIRFLDEKTP